MKTAEEWMLCFGRWSADNPLDRIRPRLAESVLPPVDFYQSVLSENDIRNIQLDALKQGYKEAAEIVSLYLTKNRLHPDIPNEKLNEPAKIASHSALQQAALVILTAMNERTL